MSNFFNTCNTLKRMDGCIRRRATGSAETFAERLDISRATLCRYLERMRDLGAPIAWDAERKSYYYTTEYTLRF